MKTHYYFLFLFVILFSCKTDSNNESDSGVQTEDRSSDQAEILEDKVDYPIDPKFDAVATFLAGKVNSDSTYKKLEETVNFKQFQTSMNLLWKKTNDKLPVIKDWTNKELTNVNKDGGTLFYPFAGADFLHADLFFPNYDTIIMLALEPIGSFPDLHQKQKDTVLDEYMNQLKKSMNAILGLSFFRTIAMAEDFQSELDGTLPVFLHFMKRTDHSVLYQERVAILEDGTITNDLSSLPENAYVGNRYYMQRNGEEKVKVLYYFAVNIQNTSYVSRGGLVAKGLDTRKDLVSFLRSSNIHSTYLKSASYLLHRPSFSIIRDLIMSESEFILQDDSGIPLQFFDEKNWKLTLYGEYFKPIRLFAERHQEDLKERYETGENVKELPFGIGYQYHKGTSNMMLAEKVR